MDTTAKAHWDQVYGNRDEAELTWFEEMPEISASLISAYAKPDAHVIDIGAGASRLVDLLIARGYQRLHCLDLSQAGLNVSRARLGDKAQSVDWIVADVTRWTPDPGLYALWHDRAAFHFLTDPDQRAAYVAVMAAALQIGGHAVIMSFALDGPERCSGLLVQRYDPASLTAMLDAHAPGAFALVASQMHAHHTPRANTQAFQISVFRRVG
jgi:SAM-dependent methyltransferase